MVSASLYPTTHFKACLDDGHWQHKDASDYASPAPEQHGLHSSGASVLKEVLLQGVVGTEVDAHSWNGPGKRLEEQMEKKKNKTQNPRKQERDTRAQSQHWAGQGEGVGGQKRAL